MRFLLNLDDVKVEETSDGKGRDVVLTLRYTRRRRIKDIPRILSDLNALKGEPALIDFEMPKTLTPDDREMIRMLEEGPDPVEDEPFGFGC